MSIRLQWSVEGEAVLDRAFQGVEAAFKDIARLIAKPFQKWFHETESEQFFSEGAKGKDGRWKPVTRATEEQKLRGNPFSLNVLQRTGALKLSLTRPGATGAVFEVDSEGITAGTSLPYAKFHQRGGKRLPVRKPIDPSESQLRKLTKEVQRDVMVPLRRTGLVVSDTSEMF